MRRRKKSVKTVADLKRHFAKRLAQRYDLFIKPDIFNEMITNNETEIIEKVSIARSIHLCIIEGREIIVVYNKKLGSVCTALPPKGKNQCQK